MSEALWKQQGALFDQSLAQWLEEGHSGEWVLMLDLEVIGFYPSLAKALKRAVEDKQRKRFIKKVVPGADQMARITSVWPYVPERDCMDCAHLTGTDRPRCAKKPWVFGTVSFPFQRTRCRAFEPRTAVVNPS